MYQFKFIQIYYCILWEQRIYGLAYSTTSNCSATPAYFSVEFFMHFQWNFVMHFQYIFQYIFMHIFLKIFGIFSGIFFDIFFRIFSTYFQDIFSYFSIYLALLSYLNFTVISYIVFGAVTSISVDHVCTGTIVQTGRRLTFICFNSTATSTLIRLCKVQQEGQNIHVIMHMQYSK